MAIEHKFLNHDWKNGFWTENAILKTDKYLPEVLFIGTNNPKTPNANFADFFYGRNYFWTGFKNLVNGNFNIQGTRMPRRGRPSLILNPTIDEIFNFCEQFKMSFADLNSKVLLDHEKIDFLNNDNVILNNIEYNLINDGVRKGIHGLAQLDIIGEVEWNTDNIIKFINDNSSIKYVYLTRKPTGIWGVKFNEIINKTTNQNICFSNIFTPSGQGAPVLNSINRLINHWLFNNNPNFGILNHNWLQNSGAQINNFNNLL
jgi:hypothetical protein